MKYRLLLLTAFLAAFGQAIAQSDEQAIKAVVTSAYIEGIHNRGNVEDIRKGFHPSFNMLRLSDNEVKPLRIEDWIASLEKSRKESPAPVSKAEGKFVTVDVSGTAAIVELELYRDNKRIFTDYLSLYKFTEGWRIVSKTFYRHP